MTYLKIKFLSYLFFLFIIPLGVGVCQGTESQPFFCDIDYFKSLPESEKIEIYKKLWLVENATIENGGLKINFPDQYIVMEKDNDLYIIYQNPLDIEIGENDLHYEIEIEPIILAGYRQEKTNWSLILGIGCPAITISFVGCFVGGFLTAGYLSNLMR